MTLANSLSVDDLIRELAIGRATLKFILERFSPWLTVLDGGHQYSTSVIPLLIRISNLLSSGMLPSQIEEILENGIQETQGPGEDIRMNQNALTFIRDMVSDIRGHQGRIAKAHEKRAQAEERKAAAIEKRAQAEEKKAQAMNNIAMALQEMGRMRAVDSHTMEIAGQAAQAMTLDEDINPAEKHDSTSSKSIDLDSGDLDFSGPDFNDPGTVNSGDHDSDNWEDDFEDPLAGMAQLLDHPEPKPSPIDSGDIGTQTKDMDDLSLLVESGLSEGDLDDLSGLIDTVSKTEPEPEDLDTLLEEDIFLPEPEDLSQLIDQVSDSRKEGSDLVSDSRKEDSDLDDLSSLVDDLPTNKDPAMDSSGPKTDQGARDIDDLSLLITDHEDSEKKAPQSMDNLSALINTDPLDEPEDALPMDDLSSLLDSPQKKNSNDDLWNLVDNRPVDNKPGEKEKATRVETLSSPFEDKSPKTPSLKPDITPDQDLAKYKAAVMKIIIELKSLGLSAKETTDRLNKDEVATLSGKPKWKENAISKIYGFIESTK